MKIRTLIIISAIWAICGLCAKAEGVQGDWSGKLDVMGAKLTLVLHINADGCTLDSPDQNAKGIPAEVLYNSDDSVSITVPSIRAAYLGKHKEGEIAGKFSQSGMTFDLILKPGAATRNRPQTPQPPFPYLSIEQTFTSDKDGATLCGTLTLPLLAKRPPIVVMVSGSGQQNRDEEIFDHKPFAVIADYLARNGIGSFRYDDRGTGKSCGLRQDLTTEDFRNDALCAIKMLRSSGSTGPIGILGHSEGGLIAFMIAGEQPDDVDFIISLAGNSLQGDKILERQLKRQADKSGVQASDKEISENLAALKTVPWYGFFLSYDPADAIAKIQCPVFAANGTVDQQVGCEENLAAIRANLKIKPQDTIKAYDGLNHLLQHSATGEPEEYAEIEETISPEVLCDIAAWIKSITKQ